MAGRGVSRADWSRLREGFDACCDLSPAERETYLAHCELNAAERDLLRAMLRADGSEWLAQDAAAQAPALMSALAADERPGSALGPWRIDALIGAGGMGRVYRAHREDGRYQGEAAIKFMAAAVNPEFFRHERHVLGRLTHPGIARLLDAGEDAAGQPYLVMEFVDGLPIDEYCRRQRLDARQRIALIIAAAEAIAHAHAQWVLHRDLKPANLLVDAEGRLKVLDFGVAKLLDRDHADPQHTTGRFFTLRYAAPEQIAGEATGVAVDLYALAVVLYELLSGDHPQQSEADPGRSLAERILSVPARSLRRCLAAQGRSGLTGMSQHRLHDLDAVLAKALNRAPIARYASVQEFAAELQRVLDDRPVLARAPGTLEQLGRFARRHRLGVTLGTLALIALIALSGLASWQAHRAATERDLAQREALRAERIASFLSQLFEAAQPIRNQGREPTARDLVDRGRSALAEDRALDPAVRRALQVVIADSYRALGQYAEAEALLVEAVSAGEAAADPRRVQWMLQLGRVHNFQSRWRDAERVLRQGLAAAGSLDRPLLLASLQRQLAVSLLNQEQVEAAEQAALAARDLLTQSAGIPVREQVDAEMLLASVAFQRGDLNGARDAYQRIVAAQRRGPVEAQGGLVTSLNNLAAIELRLDHLDEAAAHYREAIERARQAFGARNREVALPLLGLGSALRALGQWSEAEAALRESRSIYLAWAGAGHAESAYASLLLAELEWLSGDVDGARQTLGDAPAILQAESNKSAKACRAEVLGLALQDPALAVAPRQLQALACLGGSGSAPNLQLLAAYVSALRQLPEARSLSVLAKEAQQLVPRDLTLSAAIARSAQAVTLER